MVTGEGICRCELDRRQTLCRDHFGFFTLGRIVSCSNGSCWFQNTRAQLRCWYTEHLRLYRIVKWWDPCLVRHAIADFYFMSSLPLTKKNLKMFMSEYSAKMKTKQQHDQKSVASSKKSQKSVHFGKNRKEIKEFHRKMRKVVTDIAPAVKQLEASKKNLLLAKEGYLSTKDSKVDIKTLQSEVDLMTKEIALAKETLRSGYAHKPFRITLWQSYVRSSSANTALTAVETLDIVGFNEWNSVVSLFDLGKCCGIRIQTAVQATHATAAPEVFWNCSYDPENTGVFSSLLGSLASVYKTGVKKTTAMTAAVATSPASVTSDGTFHWHVPSVPPILPDQSSSYTYYTGDWFDTSNAVVIVGFLKPYAPASGSGVIVSITHHVAIDMEFKFRS